MYLSPIFLIIAVLHFFVLQQNPQAMQPKEASTTTVKSAKISMTFQRTATFHATMTFSLSGTARYLLSKTQAVNDSNNHSNSSVQVEFYLSSRFLGLMPCVTTVICMKWKHGQAID